MERYLKMSKAERLIEMMITINAKKNFTLGELAKEFSVSKRTVLRDLQELEKAGFPLYSGGVIDMEVCHATLEWVADYFLPLGSDATVLEPVELIEIMKRKISTLYGHYFKLES